MMSPHHIFHPPYIPFPFTNHPTPSSPTTNPAFLSDISSRIPRPVSLFPLGPSATPELLRILIGSSSLSVMMKALLKSHLLSSPVASASCICSFLKSEADSVRPYFVDFHCFRLHSQINWIHPRCWFLRQLRFRPSCPVFLWKIPLYELSIPSSGSSV